jgi:hypothetical protein
MDNLFVAIVLFLIALSITFFHRKKFIIFNELDETDKMKVLRILFIDIVALMFLFFELLKFLR